MKSSLNNMRNKSILLIGTLSLLVFTGCGGGGGSASFEDGVNSVALASCTGAISTWTTVSSGAVVTGDSGAVLKFDHDSSGNKKVCVVSGTATVIGA